jgi:hypothetical protein
MLWILQTLDLEMFLSMRTTLLITWPTLLSKSWFGVRRAPEFIRCLEGDVFAKSGHVHGSLLRPSAKNSSVLYHLAVLCYYNNVSEIIQERHLT